MFGQKELIELAMKHQECNQKELAAMLGVSPTQITQWKKDEHMSFAMRDKLGDLANLDGFDPTVIKVFGDPETAEKWLNLFIFLAEMADDDAETGYVSGLTDDEFIDVHTVSTLTDMGVTFPKSFPEELDVDYKGLLDDEDDLGDEKYMKFMEHPMVSLIKDLYDAAVDVNGFYYAYINHILHDERLRLDDTRACNIPYSLMDLAGTKIDIDRDIAPKFDQFSGQTKSDYREWLYILKKTAISHGVPLEAEVMDMVHQSHDELGVQAEFKAFGLHRGRLHPDIYQNEMLIGMRTIHQILPQIIKHFDIPITFDTDDHRSC